MGFCAKLKLKKGLITGIVAKIELDLCFIMEPNWKPVQQSYQELV